MKFVPTQVLAATLTKALTTAPPFTIRDGKTFVSYDGIQFRMLEPNVLKVSLLLQGVSVLDYTFSQVIDIRSDTITLNGVTGEMEFNINLGQEE